MCVHLEVKTILKSQTLTHPCIPKVQYGTPDNRKDIPSPESEREKREVLNWCRGTFSDRKGDVTGKRVVVRVGCGGETAP